MLSLLTTGLGSRGQLFLVMALVLSLGGMITGGVLWYGNQRYAAGFMAAQEANWAATEALNKQLDLVRANERRLVSELARTGAALTDLERALSDEAATDAGGDAPADLGDGRLRLNRIK